MNLLKNFRLIFLMALGLSVLSCSDDDNGTPQDGMASISVKLVDGPGDYDNVFVEVEEVLIKMSDDDNEQGNDDSDGNDDDGWISLNAINTGVVDLLDLTGGVNILLVDDFEVLAGELEEIRLVLGDDNTIVMDGETFALKTPSAQQSGLKIKVDETLQAGFGYTFILDFDVDKSIVNAGNSDNIILKPVIRATIEAATGSIEGSVVPANVETEVKAWVDGVEIASTNTDDMGNFLLIGLAPGTYTLTLTPNPESGLEAATVEDVDVSLETITDVGVIELSVADDDDSDG